ncbi:MFS transporter [Hwanghaeella grinnelliae]|uniref:MFS transporter n=1 Tax=Hwanghaeella grinnelliae TaxID=2500179 RepID=A0A3S2VLB9_9PROT|nr:MFS transporter [Hwanghaeella grinnelliae]RVU34915.1 MFS transporter [Hwanghaeella grinnelliae]
MVFLRKPSIFIVGAVVLSAILLQGGNGILTILVPLRMTDSGLPATSVGFVGTGYAIGFLIGCIFATGLVRTVGHIRAYAALAAVMGTGILALTIDTNVFLYAGVRAATGFCMAGLTTVIESWINERTPSESRGNVLSIYMVVTKGAMAMGPLMLGYGDVNGPGFLMIICAFCSMSLVPMALTRGPSPNIPSLKRMGVTTLYKIAPAAIVGCVAIGLVNGAVISLVPTYATSIDLSPTTIAFIMAGMQLGGLAFQWPLGWMSDRMDRRLVIAFCALAVTVLSLTIVLLAGMPAIVQVALFWAWGGVSFSIYAICVSHAADRAPLDLMVAMSSSLLLAWAAGAVVGPTAASFMMTAIGPVGLFYYSATVMTCLLAFVLIRTRLRQAEPSASKTDFVGLPASSPVIQQMDPRMHDAIHASSIYEGQATARSPADDSVAADYDDGGYNDSPSLNPETDDPEKP